MEILKFEEFLNESLKQRTIEKKGINLNKEEIFNKFMSIFDGIKSYFEDRDIFTENNTRALENGTRICLCGGRTGKVYQVPDFTFEMFDNEDSREIVRSMFDFAYHGMIPVKSSEVFGILVTNTNNPLLEDFLEDFCEETEIEYEEVPTHKVCKAKISHSDGYPIVVPGASETPERSYLSKKYYFIPFRIENLDKILRALDKME